MPDAQGLPNRVTCPSNIQGGAGHALPRKASSHPARWIRLWGPLAAWCSLIFVLSGIPDLSSGLEQDYLLRKAAHVLEYAVLMRLWLRASDGTFGRPPWRLAAGGLFCVLYAASDEFHQSFVPGRSGNAMDVAVDFAGIAAEAARDFLRRAPPSLRNAESGPS